MPIIASEIHYRLSGGAANASQDLSLGGAKSSNQASASIFDRVTSAEATAGDVEYRCVYVHNANATLTALDTVIWIQSNTPAADTQVAIGLGTSAIGATEQTVANENTAPAGVTFTEPANEAGALFIGDIPPNSHKAVWVRRTINAGAAANAADTFTLRVKCDTLP